MLIEPLQRDLGWSRAGTSSAIATGPLFTGFSAPFSIALVALRIDRTLLPEAPLAPAGASA